MEFTEKYHEALKLRTQDVTKWYRQGIEKYERNLTRISNDKNLTEYGKRDKTKQLREAARLQMLKDAKEVKQMHVSMLDQAIAGAKEVANQPVEVPTDEEQARFKRELARLQTESMMVTNYDTLIQKLDGFIAENVTGQYFAEQLEEQFPTLIQQAVSVAPDTNKAKQDLSKRFEQVTTQYIPEDVRGARELIEAAEAEKARPVFSLATKRSINDLLGRDISLAINNPDDLIARLDPSEEGQSSDE